ncbi:MAG: hypothetical protein EA376_14625 [Phycisphaeraceae bacterium]|nr:MAG: hypothetical protein EA376_14625 [Phycisphaeraceae bacterium]
MLTLWDLLTDRAAKRRPKPAPKKRRVRRAAPVAVAPPAARRRPIQDRYDAMTRQMLAEYGVRVRKWRSSMSGVAWEVHYEDGKVVRLIEAPKPKGPMSAAIFLHEIGHHAIGFNRYKPRCLEELRAWQWSLEAMERHGVAITDRVRDRMRDSLRYAVAKARRRGLKRLPDELLPYL